MFENAYNILTALGQGNGFANQIKFLEASSGNGYGF